MEDKPEQTSAPENKKQTILCEECKKNPSKYKCPGCSLRSCSLQCVNSHKKRTSCTGKRPLTQFVPISQFDDNLLISDYNMLEDVKRVADSAQRMRVKLCGNFSFRLPSHLQSLRNAAASRRTKLQFLSTGMSRREKNRTYYNYSEKSISWTIEWRFHSTEVVLVDHGVHESTTLSSLIENHLKPGPWNHSLKQFCDETLDSLKFLIRKNPKRSKSPFRQLNINAPLSKQLVHLVILEYPIIHVLLPSHSCDFVVINDTMPRKVETKGPTPNDYPSPKGVTYREEEIEDGGSSEPQVLDLLNQGKEERESGIESNELVRSPYVVEEVNKRPKLDTSNGIASKSCIEQLAEIGDLDFDFEPSLVNIYPEFGPDANPEDFLDFDGILFGADDEHKDLDGLEFFRDDELEEGEIA